MLFASPTLAYASDFSANSNASVELYGKTELKAERLSEKYLELYSILDKAVRNMEANVDIKKLGLSKKQYLFVYETFVNDNPQYFWLRNGSSMMINSYTNKVVSFSPMYFDFVDLDEAKFEYEKKVGEILTNVDQNWTEKEKVKYLHDYICDNVSYYMDFNKSGNFANAYGAIVDKKASCEGYSRALEDLLLRCGIQCYSIIGDDYFPGEDTPEGHMWNLVRIDGNYYHLDVTWDDQNSTTIYDYFNVSTERILIDHIIGEGQIAFPICYDYVENSSIVESEISFSEQSEDVSEEQRSRENEEILNGVEKTKISLTTSSSTKAITLKISKAKGYKVDKYEIYRSTSGKSGTFKKIKTTSKLSFKNTGLSKGKRYYYKVRGVRKVGDELVYTKWSNVSYRKAK